MVHQTRDKISNKGLEPEDFLVLHFSPSTSSQRVSGDTVRTKEAQLYFFQVVDRSELVYKPLLLRDRNGDSVGPIEPGEGTEYRQLFDEDGDDVLRNTDDPWRVYQYSVGVRQPDVRVYPRIPDSTEGGAFSWLSGSEPDPQEGDEVGYIDSGASDYDEPTSQLEHFSYKQDSLTKIQFGFYNESEEVRRQPVLSVVGFGYELRPVYREEDMLEILAQLGKRPADRDLAVHTIGFTPNSLRTFSFNTPSEWDAAENNLGVSDTNLPRNIEASIGIGVGEDIIDAIDPDEVEEAEVPRVEE